MSLPNKPFKTTSATAGLYKPMTSRAGETTVKQLPPTGRPSLGQTSERPEWSIKDTTDLTQKLLDCAKGLGEIVETAGNKSETMRQLKAIASQQRMAVTVYRQTIMTTPIVSILIEFENFVAEAELVMVRIQTFKGQYSNVDQIEQAINEMHSLVDTRWKQIENKLAFMIDKVIRLPFTQAAFQRASQFKAFLTGLISKLPLIGNLALTSLKYVGAVIGGLGIFISAEGVGEKWETYQSHDTAENLKALIIETIGLVLNVILVFIEGLLAAFGWPITLTVLIVLFLYGLYEAYQKYKDPDHQDTASQVIYGVGEYIVGAFSRFIQGIGSFISRFKQKFDDWGRRLNALANTADHIMQVISHPGEAMQKMGSDLLRELRQSVFPSNFSLPFL